MLSTLMSLLYSPWLPQGRPTGICLSVSFQSLIVWLTCTPKRNWVVLSLTHFLPEHTLYPFLFISSSPKMAYPSLQPGVCTQQISKQKTEKLLLLALFFQSFYFLFFNTAFNPGGGRVKLISLSPVCPFLFSILTLDSPFQGRGHGNLQLPLIWVTLNCVLTFFVSPIWHMYYLNMKSQQVLILTY